MPCMDRLRGLVELLTDGLGRLWDRSPRAVVMASAVAVAVFAISVTATLIVSAPADDDPTEASPSTALSFAVLAGTTIANTGPSVISGDLGVSPGTAITGFPPGEVSNGAKHVADALALQAQSDLETAYNDAVGQERPAEVPAELGGMTLVPGSYKQATALALNGTLTLDAQDDPSAVFIFQTGFTLSTASSSTIELVNGAQACNVFWQVGSSATLGSESMFVGSILALGSVTVQTGTTVTGRVLARVGQISLDTSTVTRPSCDTPTGTGPFSKVAPPAVDSGSPTATTTTTAPNASDPPRTGSTTTSETTTAPTTTDPVTTTAPTTTETTPTEPAETTSTETSTSSSEPVDPPPVDPPVEPPVAPPGDPPIEPPTP